MNTDLNKSRQLILAVQTLFEQMDKPDFEPSSFDQVYASHIHFEDSFHQLEGLDNFKQYCASLYQNLQYCRFSFHSFIVEPGQGMTRWTMDYAHPRLNGGRNIQVDGCSFLQFEDKVVMHRDYFDGGQLLYEHVPVLGRLVKFVKHRMV
ncbi:nuclear transport factor 2 family protein [Neptunicella sp. SCSIO 80796]|uniref:nuclear transport factor 2 family protein n=1 Tax=Neptunicella plasticusilytica TaxID=3117012 RepID=UPI003A4D2ED9